MMNTKTVTHAIENFRLAAFDLDGTLLDYGKLSRKSIQALMALHEIGVHVVIATGRHHKMTLQVQEALPFVRYAITANGAQVMDLHEQRMLSFESVDHESAVKIMKKISTNTHMTSVFVNDSVIFPFREMVKLWKKVLLKKSLREAEEFFNGARFVRSPFCWVSNSEKEIVKISAHFKEQEQCSTFYEELNREYDVETNSYGGLSIEISKRGVNKAFGLTRLCEHLEVPIEDTIVFGDSSNDIDILKHAGYSVAMGNASEDVKAIADQIAPSVGNDGVAVVLQEMFQLDLS